MASLHKKEKISITNEEVIDSELFKKNHDKLINKFQRSISNQYYFKHRFKKDFLMIALSAFLTVVAFDYFVSATGSQGIYPGGLGSIARFIAVKTNEGNDAATIAKQGTFYYIWYLALNVPFIIFGFWKLGSRFCITTIVFMVLQIAFDQILNAIPVINPKSWHVLINYPLISTFNSTWASAIWLFVFAIFGGILVGVAYSWVYRVDSSTGGTDFITMYFSKKKNKNVGVINRYANFIILGIIIVLNTVFLTVNNISPITKVDALNGASYEQFKGIVNDVYSNKNNFSWIGTDASTGINEIFKIEQQHLDGQVHVGNWQEAIVDQKSYFKNTYRYFISNLAEDTNFTNYPKAMIGKMKFLFVFGPSLFSSVVYIIVLSITISIRYPKFKVRTYLISTKKADDLISTMRENGFKNQISVDKPEHVYFDGKEDDEIRILTLSMTVINWKNIRYFLKKVDSEMTIKIINTEKIEGKFDYEFSNDHVQNIFRNQILNSKKLMKKIDHTTFMKTKRELLAERQEQNSNKSKN